MKLFSYNLPDKWSRYLRPGLALLAAAVVFGAVVAHDRLQTPLVNAGWLTIDNYSGSSSAPLGSEYDTDYLTWDTYGIKGTDARLAVQLEVDGQLVGYQEFPKEATSFSFTGSSSLGWQPSHTFLFTYLQEDIDNTVWEAIEQRYINDVSSHLPLPPPQCSDNTDNDGDGACDHDGLCGTFVADPGCTDWGDNDEYNEPSPPIWP